MTPAEERNQVLRSVYKSRANVSPDTEQFYARALAIMAGPRHAMHTIALIANVLIYGLWLCIGSFVLEQAWDRAQVPFIYHSATAVPNVIAAGNPLPVLVDIDRFKRCTYSITWSITDSSHTVTNYGPVIERAPGPPGHDTYTHLYPTPAQMASGHATLQVTLRGHCDGNYIDNWAPRTIDMPPVGFEAIESQHDKAIPPHG